MRNRTRCPTREPQGWPKAYAEAQEWVRTVGRHRWPDHPTNDEVWAISIADWLVSR